MSMRALRRWRAAAALPFAVAATAVATSSTTAAAQNAGHITSPKEFFGHNIGDDYWLPNYDQFMAYWHKIDPESNRMQVFEMGKSSEGRPQLAAIITAPENFKLLQHYKDISMRLAKGEGLTDDQAHALAKEGKAVVWFDGGLHATEVLGANQLIETSYELVSRNDDETKRILHDDIILAVHANPDGMQLVANWYMKDADSLKRNMNIPLLYNKYAGHDDNRDSFMSNLSETKNINHLMFAEWHPVIMYNHHQAGPAGTIMFSPPFRDPFNYNFDPMIVIGLDEVGAAIHQRLLEHDMPGFTMRSGSNYSTWWNGGLRTIGYFQGIIGILTETIGNPTPERIPFIPAQQLPRGDLPAPATPGVFHFRTAIDYSVQANYAIFDLASRYRETLLYDKYLMAKHAIEDGSEDHWTISGKRIAEAEAALSAGAVQAGAPAGGRGGRGGRGGGAAGGGAAPQAADQPGGAVGNSRAPFGAGNGTVDLQMHVYNDVLHAKDKRDARGYIIPSDQPDFLTATKFVNALRYVNVYVDQATAPFSVNGKQYPAGSYVIKTNQAARAQVLDMMEPQDHPNDFTYPGGPPRRPYDNAGWTLAFDMGVKFDRVLDAFDAPTKRIEGLAKPAAGTIANGSGASGYLMSHEINDAFTVINRAWKAGGEVYWLKSPVTAGGKTYPAGTFYLSANALPAIQKSATDLGVSFTGTSSRPADAVKVSPKRIALYDQYGGSMPSGWTRYEFEAFEIPYHARLSEGPGCRKSEEQVRRAGAAVGRADPWRERLRRARRRRPRRRERGGHPGGVSEDARPDDAGDDAAAAQAIPERRRHDRHGGHGDIARLRPRPADRESPDGAVAGTAGPCVDGRGVLRAGVDPAGRGRQQRHAGDGAAEQAGCVLRQQSGVPVEAGCGASRDEGGGLVRQRDAAAQRLGVGAELSRGRRGGGRVVVREGEGVPRGSGDHVPWAAARGFQVPL